MTKVYKVLVIGAGGHSHHWQTNINIHDNFEVCGIVDTNPDVLEHEPKIWGIDDDAVAMTIDEAVMFGIKADVALICTPIYTHHGLAIEAMRNNLHVICEKNMAHTMQAGLEMTRCAIEHPHLATVVGHQYPYWRRSNWAIKKAIRSGKLGALNAIQCNFNGGGYWSPGTPTRSGWRRFLDHDYLEDWAVHTLDLFRSFTSMDPVALSADLWRPPWSKRYGTNSINIRMLLADSSEIEGEIPLVCSAETDRARHLWKNGKIPKSWVHAQYVGHAENMGLMEHNEHWMIQGEKGSIEFMDGGYSKETKLRMIISDYDPAKGPKQELTWTESNLQPYPVDLECGPAAQWKGDNNEEEWDNNCFILEELKQCIESGGKIKPLRNFEDCIKTFAITMGAIESSKRGGEPIFLPDLWEIPR
ncbi:MAG: Gfo/Idh/MocA family protein [Candidatus Hodarchaeota archaeon]